jgi:hypothetical protein
MGEVKNSYNISVGKPKKKRPLERNGHRWEDNIIMDLRKGGQERVDWIRVTEDRDKWRSLVNTAMKFWVP